MIIVGAGLSGLIAAHYWKDCHIYEASSEPRNLHQALLRFRSNAVSNLTGIPFECVRVHKAIYQQGEFVQPNIQSSNAYSLKVLGEIAGDRSIWNLDPVDRWIAPHDFYEQLLNNVGHRVKWGRAYPFAAQRDDGVDSVINTAPLPVVLEQLSENPDIGFQRAPIHVSRYRLDKVSNVYQTIYYPGNDTNVYRASITGNILIVERNGPYPNMLPVYESFFISNKQCEPIGEVHVQEYGKIVDIPHALRQQILYHLTRQFGIYSLGRFACWRNILLDDVVRDITLIDKMMKVGSYEQAILI